MKKLDSALEERMAAVVAALQCEWVGCELHAMGRQRLLRIYIDRPGGVTVDDCGRVSRQISALLDVEDPIHERYVLEVSSPGIDRPLFTLPQYQAVLGQRIKVTLYAPYLERRHFTGLLLEATSEHVRVSLENGESVTLLWAWISKAHVIGESR